MSNTIDTKRTPISGGINADGPYWDALEAGEFRLPRCAQCQKWQWPAHWRCGECGCWENEWIEVPAVGTVYSWTRSWYAFDRTQERAGDVPYVVVLAEIEAAGGARIMGALEGDDAGLRIGARVVGTLQPPSEKSKWYPSITWSIQD